jgi:sodium/bile acid cotransporter 7
LSAISRLAGRFGVDPYLIALLGSVLLAAVLPARGAGAEFMDTAVFAAIALLFFLYGARISPQAVLAGIMHWRLQSLVFLSTFVLFPLIGLLLTSALRLWMPGGLANDLLFGLLFVSLLPSTVQSSIAFTSIARGNVPAALCSASISNLAGMILTPALVVLLLSSRGASFSVESLQSIALQLLLPFICGQAVRPFLGQWLLDHKRLTTIVDRGSILLIVYAAFSEGMVAGVWSQLDSKSLGAVVVLDLVMLAAVLAITTFASRRLGFSKEDEIAIVFCGSKKSMATGIPMANILFAGRALGLIVLPLMLFHQAQLFACALLAQRYARRAPPTPAGTVPVNSSGDNPS